jgi:integrase
MKALCLTGYYTGLRPCDLVDLRTDDVMAGGVMVIRQKKTDEAITIELPADCRAAIAATLPVGRKLIFPLGRKLLYDWLRRAIRQAGIDGSLKWLRRTGATRCEQIQPGSAKAYLGHLTDGLAMLHYVDRRQITFTRPIPPSPYAAREAVAHA